MSSPSADAVKRIHVYGHASASPQAVASAFSGTVANSPESESDLAIFAINPAAGIDQETIENWAALDDFQIPRLVVVNGLDGQELDFEDAVMVANRVFTQLVTPYLVLHDDGGEPTALIRLQDLQIIDYSQTPAHIRASDPEHEELVREFREEYFELTSEMDEGAFAAGILFPAIPINLIKGIGIDVVRGYIDLLPSGS
jgi:translation elongation factor EF-G